MVISTLLPIEFVVVVVLHLFLLSKLALLFTYFQTNLVNYTFFSHEDHLNLDGLLVDRQVRLIQGHCILGSFCVLLLSFAI